MLDHNHIKASSWTQYSDMHGLKFVQQSRGGIDSGSERSCNIAVAFLSKGGR